MSEQFDRALAEFDRANGQDPRTQSFEKVSYPRELIFARRVSAWITRLNPEASEPARLAARSHTLRRWEVPRARYPMDTAGYHAWRQATASHSAVNAEAVLLPLGYAPETVQRVRQLITGALFPRDPEAQLLEDADCLAFLELKLADYLEQWDDGKIDRVLRGTWSKMSPAARELARRLPLDPRVGHLLKMDS